MALVLFCFIFLLNCSWILYIDAKNGADVADDKTYLQEIRKGRCMASCYDQYGKKHIESVQDELYHVYQASDCSNIDCKTCIVPCGNVTNIEQGKTCKEICLRHGIICMSSCEVLMTNWNSSGITGVTGSEQIESVRVTCQHIATKGTVTVFLNWNVAPKYARNIVFIISLIRGKSSKTWKTLGQINRAVVPIHGLTFETNYMFKVTVVSKEGVIEPPKDSGWIKTMKATDTLNRPSEAKIDGQKVHNGLVSVLLKWNSGTDPPCYYRLHWMTNNPLYSDYSTDELMAPPISKYWINNLHFGSNYTLHMSSYSNSDFNNGSEEIVVWFITADCLDATNYDYYVCAPGKPRNVTGDIILKPDNTSTCSVNVSWTSPYHMESSPELFSYLIRLYKVIPIYLSQYIEPHQEAIQISGDRNWVEINDIQWDYNYSINVQAVSSKGQSKPVTLIVTNEGCQQSVSLESTATADDKSDWNLAQCFYIGSFLMIALSIRNIELNELNPLYCHGTDYITHLQEDNSSEIEFSSLTLLDVLGEGAFGKVYKAKLNDNKLSKEKDLIVAVKMLKDFHDAHEKKSLIMEIEFMKQLGSHPHIVSFIGCCKRDTVCLLMDYCRLGDLRSFLLHYRQRLQKDYGTLRHSSGSDSGMNSSVESSFSSQPSTELHQDRLLSYARQIVLAMEYMASKKFIHRDLAARNILMYDEERLKVSDFGLTRDIYERNLYQPTSARKLPYKWMALEAIFDQVFTIKSDIWSFGIVLWEIVTLGGSPYPGIPNKDLFNLLKEGYRMEKPENCSLEVYQMMLSVWHPNPYCRPSFTELKKKLEGMLEQTKPYINLSVSISKDYYESSSLSDHSDRGTLHPNDNTTYVEMSTKDSILTYETPLNG
ncbi:RET [Mytilus coruscus]|uniref:receptor protein-tyrosine kinase n=1 Tax=Mytilus coruscus TaxID=42192 RepID=A0A6J8BTG2_MYTCO|nr:RET [Mytilus coruscus]